MSYPTFYIPPDQITGGKAVMSGDELRHARTTLRLGPGDEVRIIDGIGKAYSATFQSVEKDRAILATVELAVEPPPCLDLTIAMGIVQGERFDWAIQKGTELGASTFLPLVTERTEVRIRGKWKRIPRLERIVISACKQCGRARFPVIREPLFLSALDTTPYDLSIVFWEEEGVPTLREASGKVGHPGSCLMIIGPVGGLTGHEVDLLREKGCVVAGMGSRVLRTETAVTAGTALLQFLWGDMG